MPIRAEYVSHNLIARDWKKLVRFYSAYLDDEPKPPERAIYLAPGWIS